MKIIILMVKMNVVGGQVWHKKYDIFDKDDDYDKNFMMMIGVGGLVWHPGLVYTCMK